MIIVYDTEAFYASDFDHNGKRITCSDLRGCMYAFICSHSVSRLTLLNPPPLSISLSGVFTMTSKSHPPLMKKHSQTDLISRLKSRKILGVGGEDDDGEVHRSKVR